MCGPALLPRRGGEAGGTSDDPRPPVLDVAHIFHFTILFFIFNIFIQIDHSYGWVKKINGSKEVAHITKNISAAKTDKLLRQSL